jgi:hypothetical protein
MTLERNLGPQPLAQLLERHQLAPTDLVRASQAQLTHKTVARAVKGRRLTANSMKKVLAALNAAAASHYASADLFNYAPVEVAGADEAREESADD